MEPMKTLMKMIVRVQDVVLMAKRFKASPVDAMREVVTVTKEAVRDALEQVMSAELELFLGEETQKGNKRNGFVALLTYVWGKMTTEAGSVKGVLMAVGVAKLEEETHG